MRAKDLTLYEEVMLLSLKDEKGTIESGAWYHQAVAGAILAELLLTRRIRVESERKKRFAKVVSRKSLNDPLLDECLKRIATSQKRQQLTTWLQRFANIKQLKHRVARQLCRKGVLREEEDKVMLIFRRRIYPEVDPGPERDLIEKLQRAVLTDSRDVDARTGVLVALANHTNLLKNAIDKKQLKRRKKRIEALAQGDAISGAAKDAVQAAQAAAAMAAIMPAIMAATITTSST